MQNDDNLGAWEKHEGVVREMVTDDDIVVVGGVEMVGRREG